MGRLLLVWGLLALGCSSSDGGSPTDKCDDLLTAYCGHAADCIVQNACDAGVSRDQENAACLTSARQLLACGNAKAVGPAYSNCLNDASTTACTAYVSGGQCTVPALPADCKGVILF